MQSSAKFVLRTQIKEKLKQTSVDSRKRQSSVIAQKVFQLPAFKQAKRVSIYLSTEYEVDTIDIVRKMFTEKKEVFVPTYFGKEMEMLKLYDIEDYEKLPLTKWNIKQPNVEDAHRENPMLTVPLDLILLPGVAFTKKGGRLGHGKGFYDKYLHRYFNRYSDSVQINKTHLIGLAFREQIVNEDQLPLEPTDYILDSVISSD